MIKKSILLSILSISVMSNAALLDGLKLTDDNLVVSAPLVINPSALGALKVYRDDSKFCVQTPKGKLRTIKPCFVNKELRRMDKSELAKLLTAGSYLRLKQNAEGDYALDLDGRLQAGGPIGGSIGCFLGKGLVYGVSYGAIGLVSAAVSAVATPVAGAAVGGALRGIFGPAIEGASNVAAVTCGIAGAALTGPV